MRIRVEIEWQGQPWRRIKLIRKIALIDMTFGLILALFYIYKLYFPEQEPTFIQYARTHHEQMNLRLAFVFLVAANLIQSIHAFRMYLILNQREGREPAECYSRARRWFDYSEFVYLFAIVKCLATVGYVFTVALHLWVFLMALVTVPEMIFKLWALYHCNGFMKDLRQSLQYMPKFKFIPVTGHGLNEALLFPPPITANDKEHLLQADLDLNANFQQLV
ncbi:hypothetical protein Ocin01_07373 [Orchesella cincta]|uniref:Uncharacterized protein n=1 Tax=Orchesella cincta TaxID=48709 RepID=A0A1D2N241_ORCCI|nr:hypothetical protein Ocin01_07373 [Orchesella cincta]